METKKQKIKAKAMIFKNSISKNISTVQKGKLMEGRIVELLTLYGTGQGLTCYLPIADDEGLDIIVMRRGKFEPFYIQVKSRFLRGQKKGCMWKVSVPNAWNRNDIGIVFVAFDLASGELLENIMIIPTSAFFTNKLATNKIGKSNEFQLYANLRTTQRGKFKSYIIKKNNLANKILNYM